MPQVTDLNVAPYYDDFGENDNFTISDEIAVIFSRNVAEDVVKILWDSTLMFRLTSKTIT